MKTGKPPRRKRFMGKGLRQKQGCVPGRDPRPVYRSYVPICCWQGWQHLDVTPASATNGKDHADHAVTRVRAVAVCLLQRTPVWPCRSVSPRSGRCWMPAAFWASIEVTVENAHQPGVARGSAPSATRLNLLHWLPDRRWPDARPVRGPDRLRRHDANADTC